jgi:hypothetical protein
MSSGNLSGTSRSILTPINVVIFVSGISDHIFIEQAGLTSTVIVSSNIEVPCVLLKVNE